MNSDPRFGHLNHFEHLDLAEHVALPDVSQGWKANFASWLSFKYLVHISAAMAEIR